MHITLDNIGCREILIYFRGTLADIIIAVSIQIIPTVAYVIHCCSASDPVVLFQTAAAPSQEVTI